MTDLERFFRRLVRNLAATDPAGVRRPISLREIRDTIVPYRANRKMLELESSEDYELVLMQLCAGEGGFARTAPEEVRASFEAELRSGNPDLRILHLHERVVLRLDSASVAQALNPQPELAFAPPAEIPGSHTLAAAEPADHHCSRCSELFPTGHLVNFCPRCGGDQRGARIPAHGSCAACGGQVEPGWRHCVTCGFLIS